MADARLNIRVDSEKQEFTILANQAERASNDMVKSVRNVNKELARQKEVTEKVSSSNRVMRSTISGANQTLFSFGDIVNDAQQFQFGFAQGSRAIGNNIAFMSEQFANVSNRAGGFTGALKAMGSSLLGPGGIILGINIAITAISLFGEKLFGAKKATDELDKGVETLTDRLDSLVSALGEREFFGEDEFSIKQLEFKKQRIQEEIERTQKLQERFDLTTEEEVRLVAQAFEKYGDNKSLLRAQLNFIHRQKQNAESLDSDLAILRKKYQDINKELQRKRDLQEDVNRLTGGGGGGGGSPIDIGRAGEVGGVSVFGAGAEAERQREEARFAELGTTRTEFLQELADREVHITQEKEDKKTQIQKIAETQRSEIMTNAISAASDLIGQAFGQSKGLAIAQTLVSTYASAQKAYESQLAIPTPDAPARAAAAAAVAVAQGLARLAAIRSTDIGSGGGWGRQGGGQRGGSRQGFKTETLSLAEQERRRGLNAGMFENQFARRRAIQVNVTNKIDRKGAALLVRDGERELKNDLISV